MSEGIRLIENERERQGKLWGDEHDDGHVAGDLSEAAICYAQVALTSLKPTSMLAAAPMPDAPASWPWPDWWNPNWSDPVRALVKAGAMIAAEIDRLQRASS